MSKRAIGKHGQSTALDKDLHLSAGVQGVKQNIIGILQHDLREEQLAAGKAVAGLRAKDLNADAAVAAGMVEGTAHHRAMGIVGRLSPGIVDQKTGSIAVKAAIDEYIVAAVIDAAVQILGALHIGEHMKFTVMADVDTGTTIENMAV